MFVVWLLRLKWFDRYTRIWIYIWTLTMFKKRLRVLLRMDTEMHCTIHKHLKIHFEFVYMLLLLFFVRFVHRFARLIHTCDHFVWHMILTVVAAIHRHFCLLETGTIVDFTECFVDWLVLSNRTLSIGIELSYFELKWSQSTAVFWRV